jgi:hypothetical protein
MKKLFGLCCCSQITTTGFLARTSVVDHSSIRLQQKTGTNVKILKAQKDKILAIF